jgi:hypothetical protein
MKINRKKKRKNGISVRELKTIIKMQNTDKKESVMRRRLLFSIGNIFKKLSIANKFIVSLFVLLLLPLSGIFIWINSNVTHQIYDQKYQMNLEILKQTKSPITYLIGNYSGILTSIS